MVMAPVEVSGVKIVNLCRSVEHGSAGDVGTSKLLPPVDES